MSQDISQWLKLATDELGLTDIKPEKFPKTGEELCEMSLEDFINLTNPISGCKLDKYLRLIREGKSPNI